MAEHLTAAGRVYQGQASTGVAAIPQPPRAINPSCFGSIESARVNTEQTATRVRQIVDRLAGCYPDETSAADNNKGPSSDGLCDIAIHDSHRIVVALSLINEQLDRLERALP